MILHNEYFDGNVQSLVLEGHDKPATIGVMAKGEYEFGTQAPELMRVVAGELVIKLAGQEQWSTFGAGGEFTVPGGSSFQVRAAIDTAYLCIYG